MSDTIAPPESPEQEVIIPRRLRGIITLVVLFFCAGLIAYLVWAGRGDNSLHASAMSWAWTMILVVLAGIGLAKPAEALIAKLKV